MPKLKTQSVETKTAGDLRNSNTRGELYNFVQRFERLQEEKEGIAADQKEVMAEAKGLGFDTAIIRKVIQRRKADSATLYESDALLELYEDVIKEAEKAERDMSIAESE